MDNSIYAVLNDPQRLRTLQNTALLDSPTEESFDRLSRLAARLLRVPVALVTLVDADRQYFKSCIGLPQPWAAARETPLSHSFCQHVVANKQPLIVEDARQHPLLSHNKAVSELDVIAYLGMPLTTSAGFELGSFCVIDNQPRHWTEEDIQLLRELSHSVITEIELRLQIEEQQQAEEESTLLLEISRLLSTSLELPTLLPQIAQRIVPQMADWTILHLHQFEKGTVHTGIAHHQGTKMAERVAQVGKAVRRLEDEHPVKSKFFLGRESLLGNPQAMQTILDCVPLAQRRALLELGAHAFLRVPILSQNELIGTILLVSGGSRRPYKTRNLLLVEELAQMIAIAAQNHRLYKQAQQALVRRDEFLQIAAHEVKNPITAVRLGAELLPMQLVDRLQESEAWESYEGLMIEINRLERLVHGLFDISLVDVGQLAVTLRPVNLTVVVQRTVSEMRKLAPAHTIAVQMQPDPVTVTGDEMRLEQVLYNLLRNAVKYSPEGSQIAVTLGVETDTAVVSVSDEGIGITEEQIPRLFDRFYRVNPASHTTKPGLGVGLYLVSEIVTHHNGRIEVESTIGEGSIFTVFLPLPHANHLSATR